MREQRFQLAGQRVQLHHVFARVFGGEHAANLAQINRKQEQRGELRGKCLGGCHADLRPGVGVDGAGRFASDHGAHHIADGQRLRAFGLGFALRRDGVGGFAGLGDQQRQRPWRDDGVAIAILAGVIHFYG